MAQVSTTSEVKRSLTAKQLGQLDAIFKRQGLTATCAKTGEHEYTCTVQARVRDHNVALGRAVFTMRVSATERPYAYLENWDNYVGEQEKLHARGLLPHVYLLGVQTLLLAAASAKQLGAEYLLLLPIDTGSGKLFQLYKQLGFKCVAPLSDVAGAAGAAAGAEQDLEQTTDFPDTFAGTPTIADWYANCEFMLGDIDRILAHCCEQIRHRK